MTWSRNSCYKGGRGALTDRFALHLSRDRRRLVDPADVYFLEAEGATTRVRLRGARALRDVRRLPELLGRSRGAASCASTAPTP